MCWHWDRVPPVDSFHHVLTQLPSCRQLSSRADTVKAIDEELSSLHCWLVLFDNHVSSRLFLPFFPLVLSILVNVRRNYLFALFTSGIQTTESRQQSTWRKNGFRMTPATKLSSVFLCSPQPTGTFTPPEPRYGSTLCLVFILGGCRKQPMAAQRIPPANQRSWRTLVWLKARPTPCWFRW